MTVFKQRAGLLKSARSLGALGLLLALMMVGVGYISIGTVPVQLGCITPPSGLLEWWPLDETSGNVVNNLISHPIPGHGSDLHNGTTNPGAISSSSGPAAVPGKVAGALQFDGVDDFVEVPDGSGTLSHGNPTSDFTIDAWVKVDSQDASGVRPIVDKRFDFPDSQDPNVPTRGYALYLYNGKLGFQLADDMAGLSPICDSGPPFTANCTNYGSTSPNVADGQWHHVAVTVQRTGSPTVTLYVDGSPVLTKGARTGNANNSIPLLIGSGYPIVISKPFFKGAIDELEIFNRALTQQEIQGIFKAGPAGKCKPKPGGCVTPPPDMVAWYPMDEPNGATTVADIASPPGSTVSDVGTPKPAPVGPIGTGPTPVAGKVGAGALYFYGPYVEVPPSADLTFPGDFSIDAWVRAVGCGPGILSPIVDKFDTGTNTGFSFYLDQSPAGTAFLKLRINASTFTSTGSFPATANPLANTGPWVHVAVTVDRTVGVGTFYINGFPAGTFTPPSGSITNTLSMLIGEIRVPGGRCEIAIDELEIFNRALTQAEIQAIYNAGSAGKCKPGGCVTPPPGMTGWWPLDETTGPANDLAGFNDTGTWMNSPVSVTGKVAGALSFNGQSFVEVANGPDLNFGQGDFTIDAWVKRDPSNTDSPPSVIVDKRDSSGVGYSFSVSYGRLVLTLSGTNYATTSTPVPVPADNQWHFVAVTVNRTSNTVQFYADGNTLDTLPISPSPGNLNNTSPLRIGSTVIVPGNQRWLGEIDELELYKRALSSTEIQAIFKAGSAGKCKPTADLGDAPDSTNHSNKPMTAYASVPAKFPTVFDSTTGLPQGPKHLNPKGLAWLGKDVSFENEADLLPDTDSKVNIDPSNNVADQDGFDDGVTLPIAIPMVCGQTQFTYTVTSTAAAKLYVNVWFDFNHDGDWDDPITKCPLGPATTGSFTEWAVQNQLITVGGSGTFTFTTPAFGAANPTMGSDMWMRITLTDQPIAPVNGADGSGPAGGYKYGETEDYLLELTYSELCGIKFNDLNGNGQQDPGEPGLANWVIEVEDANGNFMGYAVTDADGKYCIPVPSPGTYTVSEQQQAGWTQTAPASGSYTVTVPPARTDLHFGNQQKGKAEICVFKFEDLDGDGVQGPNEPLLGGWQFTVSPAPLPPATSPVTTGPQGGICFGVSAPGTYTITEQTQSGWTPTTPTSQTVTVTPGQLVNVYFGNRKAAACDLAIKKTAKPSPLVSGQPATVTITVTNVGTAPCPGPTTVTETVPAGLTLVSASGPGWLCIGNVCTYLSPIPVNGSVSVTYTFNVTAPPGTAIQNCASVSNQNDPNVANNRDCVTTLVGRGAGQCDREIKKTVSPNPVPSGGTVTITLTVTNVGTAPCPAVGGINVADPQPTGLTFNTANPPTVNKPGWSCGFSGPIAFCTSTSPLLPGAANAVTITFTATVTAPAGSQIQNCAEVTNVGDANQANNKSCVTINVKKKIFPPDLTLAKLLDGVLRAEQEATYVLRVTNLGEERTTKPIRVSDPLPAGLRFVSAAGVGWSCSASGQIVTCTSAGPIAPNQDSTILLKVRVAAQAGTQITNCATVETEDDANPANNRGCHTGTVQR